MQSSEYLEILKNSGIFLDNAVRTSAEALVANKLADICYEQFPSLGYPLGLVLGTAITSNLLKSYNYAFTNVSEKNDIDHGYEARNNLYNTNLSAWRASNILLSAVSIGTVLGATAITNYYMEDYNQIALIFVLTKESCENIIACAAVATASILKAKISSNEKFESFVRN